MEGEQQCKFRNRMAPVRKWNDKETRQLIEFLKNHELEKPTARVYYNYFIEEYGMDTKWNLVRGKVRNMRMKLLKAIEWKKANPAGPLMTEDEIHDVLKRMCPLFDDLYAIFSKSKHISDPLEQSQDLNFSGDTRQSQDSTSDLSSLIKVEAEEVQQENVPADTENDSVESASDCEIEDKGLKKQEDVTKSDTKSDVIWLRGTFIDAEGLESQEEGSKSNTKTDAIGFHGTSNASSSRCRVSSSSNTALHPKRPRWNNLRHDAVPPRKEDISLQRARLALEQKKLELEKEKMHAEQQERQRLQNAEFELKEKQLAYEKEKTFRELELKQREIEKEERLKMCEIESKERIALKELEYKYKVNDAK